MPLLAWAYGIEAIADAGLEAAPSDASRIGIAIGSGIGGINTIENTHGTLMKGGPRRVSPFFVPASIINMIGGNLSIRYGFNASYHAVLDEPASAYSRLSAMTYQPRGQTLSPGKAVRTESMPSI